MAYKTLLFEKEGNIATITLNRPQQLNALDLVMRVELISLLTEISADKSIKVLVLTGGGRASCAGGNITTDVHALMNRSETGGLVDE